MAHDLYFGRRGFAGGDNSGVGAQPEQCWLAPRLDVHAGCVRPMVVGAQQSAQLMPIFGQVRKLYRSSTDKKARNAS